MSAQAALAGSTPSLAPSVTATPSPSPVTGLLTRCDPRCSVYIISQIQVPVAHMGKCCCCLDSIKLKHQDSVIILWISSSANIGASAPHLESALDELFCM